MSIRQLLATLAIVLLPPAVAQVSAQQTENLVFYYPFDDGAATVTDATGNGNTGTLMMDTVDGTYPAYTEDGRIGGAMDFGPTGNAAWIDVTVGSAFENITTNDAFTISWFQIFDAPAATPSSTTQFNARNATDARVIGTHAPFNNSRAYFDTNYASGAPDRNRIEVNPMADSWTDPVWTHVALVKDGLSKSLYLNGEVIGSSAAAAPLLAIEQVSVGADRDGGNSFNGLIDDFAVWEVALSEAEIIQLSQIGVEVGLPGDVNADGFTNSTDFDILSGNVGQSPAEKTDGDLNRNNIVDLADFRIWKSHDGCFATGDGFECPSEGLAAGGAVPEPAGLALMVIAGFGGAFWSVRCKR